MPFDDWKAQFASLGWPEPYIEMLKAKDESIDNVASHSAATFGQTSFSQWVRDELAPIL